MRHLGNLNTYSEKKVCLNGSSSRWETFRHIQTDRQTDGTTLQKKTHIHILTFRSEMCRLREHISPLEEYVCLSRIRRSNKVAGNRFICNGFAAQCPVNQLRIENCEEFFVQFAPAPFFAIRIGGVIIHDMILCIHSLKPKLETTSWSGVGFEPTSTPCAGDWVQWRKSVPKSGGVHIFKNFKKSGVPPISIFIVFFTSIFF